MKTLTPRCVWEGGRNKGRERGGRLLNFIELSFHLLRWQQFEIAAQKLCSGDWDRTLRLTVWDWNRSANNPSQTYQWIIGSSEGTVCRIGGGIAYVVSPLERVVPISTYDSVHAQPSLSARCTMSVGGENQLH